MKKKLFSILLSLAVVVTMIPAAGSVAFAEDGINLDTAFPDEVLRAYIKEKYDTDENNFLSDAECEAAVNVYEKEFLYLDRPDLDQKYGIGKGDIADFTGIEQLTFLKGFSIGGREDRMFSATEVDVSTLTGLVNIGLENTNISKIDVSKNTNLSSLAVINTPVASLDISKNTDLERLSVWNTNVSALDLSNNNKLISLSVVGSNVTSLDISNFDPERFQDLLFMENASDIELLVGCTAKEGYERKFSEKVDMEGVTHYVLEGTMKVKHQEVTTKGKAATCTASGLTDKIECSACGEVIQAQQTIAAKGHTAETVAGKAATCTASGLTEGSKCSVCGTVIKAQQTIAAKGHTATSIAAKKATTTVAGKTKGSKCSVCGKVLTAQKTVPAAKNVKLAAVTKVYTGKALKPAVTVKDAKGNAIASSNYTVSYANNKKVGKATATVTFKGNYTGTKALSFKINPKKAAVKSATVGKKKITVKAATKVAATGGTKYKIAYKVKGASKWNYTTATSQSKEIKNLKKGKAYQVKIRAIKGDYAGAWSAVKTTKKVK